MFQSKSVDAPYGNVRMQEIFDTFEDPNARAMAFRRFEAEERTRRRVSRGPRWR